MPRAIAAAKPRMRPSSTAMLATKPVKSLLITRIVASTSATRPRLIGSPKFFAPTPPPAQLMPMRSSVMPITVMIVPVTSAGK